MLGWELFIQVRGGDTSVSDDDHQRALASWRAGISGTEWIEELVANGEAVDQGGNGYPNRYTLSAGTLKAALLGGVPKHAGPLIIGDNYVVPSAWIDSFKMDVTYLNKLEPSTILEIEAWDQS